MDSCGKMRKKNLDYGGRKMMGISEIRQTERNLMKTLVWRLFFCLFLSAGFLLGALLSARSGRSVQKAWAAENTADGIVRSGPGYSGPEGELHGIWISYLVWNSLPKEEKAFQAAVDQMFERCREWGMNAVFVHVRSHGDAMYPSSLFPWSKFASGTQGQNPGYDPLSYMVQSAHARGLQFHAWVNPYRITGYQMSWEEVSDQSPAKRWLSDSDASNDRNVLKQDGTWYYNPASETVKQMVIDGVMEVVRGYDVDGIHFDDYFYPDVDDRSESRWFDYPEYQKSGSSKTSAQWRRDQVSDLVSRVYKAVKEAKPSVIFGISPQGYLANLRSDTALFVDIDRWLSQDGFVDYIMPQLYWGFEAKTSDGKIAPFAFSENLKSWTELVKKGHAKLYLGLGMYRAGTNVKDNNEVSEWLRYDDVISRQVQAGRNSGFVSGYCFYSYDSFLEETAAKEKAHLLPLLK